MRKLDKLGWDPIGKMDLENNSFYGNLIYIAIF